MKTLPNLEKRLWNWLALGIGYALAPFPRKFAYQSRVLTNWHFNCRNSYNIAAATAIINALGLGAVHKQRVEELSRKIFSTPADQKA